MTFPPPPLSISIATVFFDVSPGGKQELSGSIKTSATH